MEIAIKVIIAIGGLFGIFKVYSDFFNARSARRRENYKLTKEFMADFQDGKQPQFLIQNGFLALTGHLISVPEIKYLLGINNPLSVVDRKPSNEHFIYFDKKQNNYCWKDRYSSSHFQKFGWWYINLLYVVLMTFAILPHLGGVKILTVNLYWTPVSLLFFILAIFCLNLSDNFKNTKKFIELIEKESEQPNNI